MPKKKRFRSRFGDDGGGRSRGKRRQSSGRRGFHGPRLGPDGQPMGSEPGEGVAVEGGEEEVVKEFVGMLEMHPNGYGFLRSPENNYSRERTDPFVPGTMIEKFGLRQGVMIRANMVHARRQQGPRVKEIVDVDGLNPEQYSEIKQFDNLTAINPEQWLKLETGQFPLTNRVIDLLTPLGEGNGHSSSPRQEPVRRLCSSTLAPGSRRIILISV